LICVSIIRLPVYENYVLKITVFWDILPCCLSRLLPEI
jgi:hypothetical protein